MKTLFLLPLFLTLSVNAAVERRSLDMALPSQQMVERQVIVAPGATTTASILSANAGNTSAAAATVSSFLAQPDVPRALVITPGGTTTAVAPCAIIVSGTSITGSSISDTFFFTNNQSTPSRGNKAFKTVTSVAFPANCEDGSFNATWSVGYDSKLGLKKCMRNTGNFFHATLNGVLEATRPTITYGATLVEDNTIVLSSALNSTDVEAFFMQNYRCSP